MGRPRKTRLPLLRGCRSRADVISDGKGGYNWWEEANLWQPILWSDESASWRSKWQVSWRSAVLARGKVRSGNVTAERSKTIRSLNPQWSTVLNTGDPRHIRWTRDDEGEVIYSRWGYCT
jgi:hypothetical protein